MEPFRIVSGIAAPLLRDNVDTDALLPKQFLTTISRVGLGKSLFNDLRYDEAGGERPDFVLNQGAFRRSTFLVSGANFGCGSSREHAPWALADFGIRAIVAISFADIFAGNCTKNGIVPIALPEASVQRLARDLASDPVLTVNLETQVVLHRSGPHPFALEDFSRSMLLRGLDDIAWTDERGSRIGSFEDQQREREPWLWSRASPALTR